MLVVDVLRTPRRPPSREHHGLVVAVFLLGVKDVAVVALFRRLGSMFRRRPRPLHLLPFPNHLPFPLPPRIGNEVIYIRSNNSLAIDGGATIALLLLLYVAGALGHNQNQDSDDCDDSIIIAQQSTRASFLSSPSS